MSMPEIVVDTHNDLPWKIRLIGGLENYDFKKDHTHDECHTDLNRMRKGGLTVQFWSVYVPTPTDPSDNIAVIETLEQIETTHRLIESNQESLKYCTTSDEARAAVKDGKIASLLGMEGGQSIGCNLQVLGIMYRLGCRYMTLTHNGHLPWVDSHVAQDGTKVPLHGGLTDFGKSVVKEMQRLGMMVDLSHVSEDTMKDALKEAKAPVFFSHSNARAICNNTRNVPDDVLKLMAENGGVCQVTFVEPFTSEECRLYRETPKGEKPRATISQLVDHIDHICKVTGSTQYVGIGGDYDGCTDLVENLHDVSCYPNLVAELKLRKYSENDIANICGENILRMLKKCEEFASS